MSLKMRFYLPSNFIYFNEDLHSCNGRRNDVTCSCIKCNVTCGHNNIYEIVDNYFYEVNTKYISLSVLETSVSTSAQRE